MGPGKEAHGSEALGVLVHRRLCYFLNLILTIAVKTLVLTGHLSKPRRRKNTYSTQHLYLFLSFTGNRESKLAATALRYSDVGELPLTRVPSSASYVITLTQHSNFKRSSLEPLNCVEKRSNAIETPSALRELDTYGVSVGSSMDGFAPSEEAGVACLGAPDPCRYGKLS